MKTLKLYRVAGWRLFGIRFALSIEEQTQLNRPQTMIRHIGKPASQILKWKGRTTLRIIETLDADSHMGYVVENVDRTLKCLQEKWNCCEKTTPYLFTPTKAWTCGLPLEGLTLRIAMCQIGNGVSLELIQPVSKIGFHFLSLIANGDNLNHVAFKTSEYDLCRKEFTRMEAIFVFEAETNDRLKGYRRCFYARIEGLPGIFEILEKEMPYRPQL